MNSHATADFWKAYQGLPRKVQLLANKNYRLWKQDPFHPSLRFKKVRRFWSARIGMVYRAIGVMEGDTVIWFWIGPHDEYQRLIRD